MRVLRPPARPRRPPPQRRHPRDLAQRPGRPRVHHRDGPLPRDAAVRAVPRSSSATPGGRSCGRWRTGAACARTSSPPARSTSATWSGRWGRRGLRGGLRCGRASLGSPADAAGMWPCGRARWVEQRRATKEGVLGRRRGHSGTPSHPILGPRRAAPGIRAVPQAPAKARRWRRNARFVAQDATPDANPSANVPTTPPPKPRGTFAAVTAANAPPTPNRAPRGREAAKRLATTRGQRSPPRTPGRETEPSQGAGAGICEARRAAPGRRPRKSPPGDRLARPLAPGGG